MLLLWFELLLLLFLITVVGVNDVVDVVVCIFVFQSRRCFVRSCVLLVLCSQLLFLFLYVSSLSLSLML